MRKARIPLAIAAAATAFAAQAQEANVWDVQQMLGRDEMTSMAQRSRLEVLAELQGAREEGTYHAGNEGPVPEVVIERRVLAQQRERERIARAYREEAERIAQIRQRQAVQPEAATPSAVPAPADTVVIVPVQPATIAPAEPAQGVPPPQAPALPPSDAIAGDRRTPADSLPAPLPADPAPGDRAAAPATGLPNEDPPGAQTAPVVPTAPTNAEPPSPAMPPPSSLPPAPQSDTSQPVTPTR